LLSDPRTSITTFTFCLPDLFIEISASFKDHALFAKWACPCGQGPFLRTLSLSYMEHHRCITTCAQWMGHSRGWEKCHPLLGPVSPAGGMAWKLQSGAQGQEERQQGCLWRETAQCCGQSEKMTQIDEASWLEGRARKHCGRAGPSAQQQLGSDQG
jgi:hypothetical protein